MFFVWLNQRHNRLQNPRVSTNTLLRKYDDQHILESHHFLHTNPLCITSACLSEATRTDTIPMQTSLPGCNHGIFYRGRLHLFWPQPRQAPAATSVVPCFPLLVFRDMILCRRTPTPPNAACHLRTKQRPASSAERIWGDSPLKKERRGRSRESFTGLTGWGISQVRHDSVMTGDG